MNSLSQDMLRKAKEIVKKILSQGYEAFLVGDSIKLIALDQSFTSLEIYTSISQDKMYALFSDYKIEVVNDYQLKLGYEGNNYLISFPHENLYQDKLIVKETTKHYSKNLFDFICTKDYTISGLVMNSNNIIYDAFSGKDDLQKKRIRTIYKNPKVLYDLEPVKSLEFLKLISQTGYQPEKALIRAVRKSAKKVKNVDFNTLTSEVLAILKGANLKKAIVPIYKSKVYKYTGKYKESFEYVLSGHVKEELDTILAVGMISTKEFNEELCNYLEDVSLLRKLVKIGIDNPSCDYSNLELFEYGLNACIKANRVNTYLGNAKKKEYLIKKRYNNLPIKSIHELKIDEETVNALSEEKKNELLEKILSGEVDNTKENILKILDQEKKDNWQPKKERDNIFTRVAEYQTSEDIEKRFAEKYDDSEEVLAFTQIKKQQETFEKRLKELELQVLKRDIELDIEKKIRESDKLNNIPYELREEARRKIHDIYYEALLQTEKYKELRVTGEDNNEND